MGSSKSSLRFDIDHVASTLCRVCITVSEKHITELYSKATEIQQKKMTIHGFSKGSAPLKYITQHYKTDLIEHLKKVVFHYFVINFLYDELLHHKICSAGEPRLCDVYLEPNNDALFNFEISKTEEIDFREWKNFAFKAPKRKNYKDIDRQVDLFIKEEQELQKKHIDDGISYGDWVCFNISLVDEQNATLLSGYSEDVWLRIGLEDADLPFAVLFEKKQIGDTFVTSDECIQNYFGQHIDTDYTFKITILDIVPYGYFSFDKLKNHFRIKTNKEMHRKLIEVFSYRNDISQRRATAEEALKLLLSKHLVSVPNYLILREQKVTLESVQESPDYQVYKTQKNFKENIRRLAEKQAREMILIDQLALKENIKVSNDDVHCYLNLAKRPRSKEFIYFSLPKTKVDGQEAPTPSGILQRYCLREKTLNHVIYHLTRK